MPWSAIDDGHFSWPRGYCFPHNLIDKLSATIRLQNLREPQVRKHMCNEALCNLNRRLAHEGPDDMVLRPVVHEMADVIIVTIRHMAHINEIKLYKAKDQNFVKLYNFVPKFIEKLCSLPCSKVCTWHLVMKPGASLRAGCLFRQSGHVLINSSTADRGMHSYVLRI